MQVTDHLLTGLLEGAPDAVVCVDGNGRIALVNAQAERLFRYRRQELIGEPAEMLVPDAVRAAHPEHRGRYMADPKPRPMGARSELHGRRRDGSTFPAEISLSAVETDDGILVMAAVRDVTERLELRAEHERLRLQIEQDRVEAQLHQEQRMASLGQLAGGVAHDFNNLLSVISNYAAFVSEEAAKDPGQASWQSVRDDIGQIVRAAERAAELTHQLLAFARHDAVELRPLNLNQVITDVEQLLSRTLGEHVVLKTDLSPGLCMVLADPGRIEQVLVNLAVNARDAMPAGGTLTVTTATADIDAAHPAGAAGLSPGRYGRIGISDTGTGMTREVLDRAFEPFFTTKGNGKGTGLGLATVYGIIAQARGYVQVDSEPGVGTTFTVLLPASQETVAEAAPVEAAHAGAWETVLLVEDEPAIRAVTSRILSRNGYRVITAVDGAQAVDLASGRNDIDVLLTDVVMPGMTGKETAKRTQALRPGVKVLFMSGYTQGLLETQGVVAADVNLIEKPFTEQSLLTKLRQVIASSAA
jgi:PAS domain S-box-containing protein